MPRPIVAFLICLSLLGVTSLVFAYDDSQNPERIEINAPVVDLVGVLGDVQTHLLDQKLRRHHRDTGVQMAVLIVDSTAPTPIEQFSLTVAENWEGGSADRDDGILLTFAIDDRRNRLELGYGMEAVITDSEAQRILDDATPLLREQRYGQAAIDIVDAVIDRTDHLDPDGALVHGGYPPGGYAAIAIPAVYLLALFQAFWWRRRRGELHSDWAIIDDRKDNDEPGRKAQEKLERAPNLLWKEPLTLKDLAWWMAGAVAVIAIFAEGGYWRPMIGLWVLVSLFAIPGAHLIPSGLSRLIAIAGLAIFAALPAYLGLFPVPVEQVTTFVNATAIISVVIALFASLFVLAGMSSLEHHSDITSNGISHSSGIGFGGGGGGFGGGGGGGFGGGGGGFGGGGASGGW